MECLWGNTSIIIPKHKEETFLWKRTRKISATATTILFLDVTSFSSF
jgi:hypothetical protein